VRIVRGGPEVSETSQLTLRLIMQGVPDGEILNQLGNVPGGVKTGPAMSNGTRYLPSPAPAGKFQIVGVNGAVLTLQLVGTAQTYTFDTTTDTYG
jgi:hypothetical protein